MEIILWVIAVVAGLIAIGQYLSNTSDCYLSIKNPQPLDENAAKIVIKFWGFIEERWQPDPDENDGLGFADVRIYATRKQVLVSLFTIGLVRPLTVVWRGNAGRHPLGQA
ncbi:MAG: hypothetical protein ABR601_03400 [Parasphingopyxis sp.]|nr:hypothetical protein [Sphingomonadales bacterium]